MRHLALGVLLAGAAVGATVFLAGKRDPIANSPSPAVPGTVDSHVVPVAARGGPASPSEGAMTFTYVNKHGAFNLKWEERDSGYGAGTMFMAHSVPETYGAGVVSEIKRAGAVVRWVPEECTIREKDRLVSEIGLAGNVTVDKVSGRPDSVMYRGTYEGVDERFTLRGDGGIEHDIILTKRPANLPASGDLVFSGRLEISGGATLWVNGKQITGKVRTRGPIIVKALDGTDVAYMHAPVAYDRTVADDNGRFLEEKALRTPGHSTYPDYSVEMLADGGYRLSVNTPASWLARPTVEYPVTIDPFLAPLGPDDFGYVGSTDNQVQNIAIYGSKVLGPEFSGWQGNEDGFVIIPVSDPRIATGGIPFAWSFYGIWLCPYSIPCWSIIVPHVNGYLRFLPPPPPAYYKDPAEYQNTAIPSHITYAIFALWDDLEFSSSASGVYLFTAGTFPRRQMIWQWHDMGFRGVPGHAGVDFSIILNEGLRIRDHTIWIQFGNGFPDPGQATTGIQDGGDVGIMANFNSPITSPARVAFKVNSPPFACPWLHPDYESLVTDSTGASAAWDGTCPNRSNPTIQRILVACAPIKLKFVANRRNPPTFYAVDDDGDTISYRWKFWHTNDPPEQGTESYAPAVEFNFTRPGLWYVDLTVADSFGNTPTGRLGTDPPPPPYRIQVQVYKAPIITEALAMPSGGAAPLNCIFRVRASLADNVLEEIRMNSVAPITSEVTQFIWDFGDGSPTVIQAAQAIPQKEDPSHGYFEPTDPPTAPYPPFNPYTGKGEKFPPVDWVGVGGSYTGVATWAPDTPVAENTVVMPTAANGYVYLCLKAGTTGSTEPTWPTLIGYRVTDNDVEWVCVAPPGDITHTYTSPGLYMVRVSAVGAGNTVGSCDTRTWEFPVYVTDPANWINDKLLITTSSFRVDWAERLRLIKRLQNCSGGTNRTPNPPEPWELANRFDTFKANGYINLPGTVLSDLSGKYFRFMIRDVNGANPYTVLYQGPLDANGLVNVVDRQWGRQGTFRFSLPSGRFSMNLVRQYLANLNSLNDNPIQQVNTSEEKLLPMLLRFDIGTYTPGGVNPPSFATDVYTGEVIISYEYESSANKWARGLYRYAQPAAYDRTMLESGVVLVTKAVIRPAGGGQYVVKLDGALSRPGGDSIRPAAAAVSSDFTVQIGGFSETINTAANLKWNAGGAPPRTRISFSDAEDKVGIRRMSFAGYCGRFSITTWPIDAATLGIDPNATTQTVPLRVVIVTDNQQTLDARTSFEVQRKAGDDTFTH
ncbi:MAG: PKD domain-containing protein [Planctomycetota bacterium]|nr:PKD domain-containing protein [Planctomycetota bacterium]